MDIINNSKIMIQEEQEIQINENFSNQYNFAVQILNNSMNLEETERYEVFRSSKIADTKIKKILQQSIGNISLTEISSVILKTAGKVYVGELIEEAINIQLEMNEKGPLKPKHIIEAKRRLGQQNKDLSKQELSFLI